MCNTIKCLDCGKPYDEFGLDCVLRDEQWKQIHPKERGIICSQCIINRAEKMGAVLVKMEVFFNCQHK